MVANPVIHDKPCATSLRLDDAAQPGSVHGPPLPTSCGNTAQTTRAVLENDLVSRAERSQGLFGGKVRSGYGLSQASPCVMA